MPGLRWTQEELDAFTKRRAGKPKMPEGTVFSAGTKPAKPNKYHAKRVESDGYQFDSLKEARHYAGLKLLVAAGKIRDLKVHPQFPIVIKGQTICFVELDFSYVLASGDQNLPLIIEDVKSKATNTAESRLKRKMFTAYYGVEVKLIF